MNWYEYYKQQDYLEHHGILGQKWGIRRFQNKDGSLTSQGKKRYDTGKAELSEDAKKLKSESAKTSSNSQPTTHTLTAAEAVRNIPVNKLTNQQLSDATYRMNLESNYSRALSEYNKAHMTTGQKLKNYAKKQAFREIDRQTSKIIDSLADDATKKLLSKYGVEVSGGDKDKKKKKK